jgi:hypothetical protein
MWSVDAKIPLPISEGYFTAARWASSIGALPEVGARWDEPSALPELSIGSLVAHALGGGVVRLAHLLGEEERTGLVPVDLLTAYGVHRIDQPTDLDNDLPAFVRRLSDELAAAGPQAVLDASARALGELETLLPGARADRLVPALSVKGGGMTVLTYVRTRVVELVVHADDLLTSVGVSDIEIPTPAADVALELMVELARARYGDIEVTRSLARRERAAPESFRVF